MRLIGLTGKAGVGKDCFANFINTKLNFEPYSFAGPLKDACCLLFGWSRYQVDHDREFKEAIDPRWGFSPRKAMQLMGTEYGRELLRQDLWVHMAKVRLDETRKAGLLVIDVRFENEASWIRDNGGLLVHIQRPVGAAEVPAHASEAGVKFEDGDLWIWNSGTLDDLQNSAHELAANILTGDLE
jgi:hypothetical protein